MEPVTTAALIGGGSQIAGSIGSSLFNVREARKNRRFQERMSNTSHQRETKDLEKAGLNRILGISSGAGGSSTPTGSTAQTQNPFEGTALLGSQLEVNSATALKAHSDSNLSKQLAQTSKKTALKEASQSALNSAAAAKIMKELPASETKGRLHKAINKILDVPGKVINKARSLNKSMHGADKKTKSIIKKMHKNNKYKAPTIHELHKKAKKKSRKPTKH